MGEWLSWGMCKGYYKELFIFRRDRAYLVSTNKGKFKMYNCLQCQVESDSNQTIIPFFPALVKTLVRCRRQLQQPVKLLGSEVVVEEINRVELDAVFDYFVMTVRAGAFAGTAHPADYFATHYPLPPFCLDAVHVPVKRFVPELSLIHI